MGNCQSVDSEALIEPRQVTELAKTNPSQPKQAPEHKPEASFDIKSQTQKRPQCNNNISQRIVQEWKVYPEIINTLSDFSCTQESLINIAKMMADAILAIESTETKEEEAIVDSFVQSQEKAIVEDELFYDDMIAGLKVKFSQSKMILRYCSKIRAYLRMANLKRNNETKKKTAIQGFEVDQSRNYKKLSNQEIKEAIKLENIGESLTNLGDEISFKLLQAKKGAKKMKQMIENVLLKNVKELETSIRPISKWKFDLSPLQLYIIAKISRQACEFYENGVYVLLVYLKESCRKLEQRRKPIASIENKLKESIEFIAYLYPPGSGLQGGKQLQEKLKSIEKKQKFKNKQYQFNQKSSDNQRFEQLGRIIKQQAELARDNKKHFQRLLRETCFKKQVDFLTGLKYNPDKPNQKALTRIQEKLLLKKKDFGQRKLKNSITDILESQEREYKAIVESELSKMVKLQFTISDMVRGKCVFAKIEDIIETVYDINAFVERQNQINPGLFKVYEVESRFTRSPPISDITLKIGIKDEIQAELQLTLQTNKAAYNFAHKIYELDRAKAFSKIKVVNNYFQEFTKDFCDIAQQQLKHFQAAEQLKTLSENDFKKQQSPHSSSVKKFSNEDVQKAFLIQSGTSAIKFMKTYFGLDTSNNYPYDQLFKRRISSALEKRLLNKQRYTLLQREYQSFMRIIVSLKTKIQQDNTETFIDELTSFLKQESSGQQKALLPCFILQNSFIEMKLLNSSNLNDKCQNYSDYLRNGLQLPISEQIFGENPRSYFFKQLQLQTLHNKFADKKVVFNDALRGQQSLNTIDSLKKLAKIYYQKKQYKEFESIYNKLMEKSSQKNNLGQIKLLRAQGLILQNRLDEAKDQLNSISNQFMQNKSMKRMIEAQILLAQCFIKQNRYKQYEDVYERLQKSASLNGILLQGAIIGQSSFRIAQKAFEIATKNNDEEMKRKIVDTHFRVAFNELAKYKTYGQLEKIKDKWLYFKKYYLQNPKRIQFSAVHHFERECNITFGSHQDCQIMKYKLYRKNANLQSLRIYCHKKFQIQTWDLLDQVSADYPKISELTITTDQIPNLLWQIRDRESWKIRKLIISSNICGSDLWKQLNSDTLPILQTFRLQTNSECENQILKFVGPKSNCQALHLKSLKNHQFGIEVDTKEQNIWRQSSIQLYLGGTVVWQKILFWHQQMKLANIKQLSIDENKMQREECGLVTSTSSMSKIANNFLKQTLQPTYNQEAKNIFESNRWRLISSLEIKNICINNKLIQTISPARFQKLQRLFLQNTNLSTAQLKQIKLQKQNIIELNLQKNQLNSVTADYLCEFTNLSSLNLQGNGLKDDGFQNILLKGDWKQITTLNLANNQIADYWIKKVVPKNFYFSKWEKLQILDLRNNKIGEKGICMLSEFEWRSLKKINLGRINIKIESNSIGPEGCEYLTKANWNILNYVNLGSNDIGPQGCQHLSKSNWNCLNQIHLQESNKIGPQGSQHLSKANWKNLNSINLRNNNIGPQGCQHLYKSDWSNLKSISLQSNSIGEGGCQYLSKANWKNLNSINLESNRIDPKGCQHLSRAEWNNLNSISLQINNIGPQGCQHLSKTNWTHLNSINLWNTRIGPQGCQHLSKANWKDLNFINLGSNNIGPEGCQHLAQSNWNCLNQINLQTNNIGPQGCQYLSFTNWKNIKSINLQSNNIGPQGCQHLSKTNWNILDSINLGYNNISPQGCEHLSKTNWSSLNYICLQSNKIGPEGCLHLSRATWNNLNSISLQQNSIGDKGCQHLSKCNWNDLNSINLGLNNFGPQGCQQLSRAYWKNLNSINFRFNAIGSQGCQHLIKAEWKHLNSINLGHSKIDAQGCQLLAKSNWTRLNSINLEGNSLLDKGCQHLSKANWINLSSINLQKTIISPQNIQLLISSPWSTSITVYSGPSPSPGPISQVFPSFRSSFWDLRTISWPVSRWGQ